jgi:hypothetical protein
MGDQAAGFPTEEAVDLTGEVAPMDVKYVSMAARVVAEIVSYNYSPCLFQPIAHTQLRE